MIGADPAEGNPTSDDSALAILDIESGEEFARLGGKLEPAVFAGYAYHLALWYNRASILIERNNHGHAVILWLREHGNGIQLLCGRDGRAGYVSSTLGKTQLYDAAADAFKNEEVTIHSFSTFTQLCSIDGSTLRAPSGEYDDEAAAFALAIMGRLKLRPISTGAMPAVLGAGKTDPFAITFGGGYGIGIPNQPGLPEGRRTGTLREGWGDGFI